MVVILIILYLAAIVLANLLAANFGPAVTPYVAFFLIAFDLTARDRLHDAWKGRGLWLRMLALIGTGSLLSYALNTGAGPVALASFVAFLVAGLADAATYALLGDKARLVRVNGSNVVSAALDSVIFLTLAFGWPGFGVVLVQFAAKVLGGFVWSLVLFRTKRPVPLVSGRKV